MLLSIREVKTSLIYKFTYHGVTKLLLIMQTCQLYVTTFPIGMLMNKHHLYDIKTLCVIAEKNIFCEVVKVRHFVSQ